MARVTGQWVHVQVPGEPFRAFLPHKLPPDPPVRVEAFLPLLGDADRAIGRLDGICRTLPDSGLFLYMYVRKEAVLSSQIEGTQSSLSDLLRMDEPGANPSPDSDIGQVSRYVAAMEHGVKRLREDNFPLSLRLIRELHEQLLQNARGGHLAPGEFRTSQNWVGGSRPGNALYVPPPPGQLNDLLSDLERFLHAERGLPVLLKAALVHVQFESIHPFLDGNGRIGRLLIPFVLCAEGVLREPLLYPSLFFKQNRSRYYALLQRVRTDGDWESWVEFFLTGIRDTAEQAVEAAQQILELLDRDRQSLEGLGRQRLSALQVHRAVQSHPFFTVPRISRTSGLSYPTVARAIANMEGLGMVKRLPFKTGPQIFTYDRYLQILNEGTEPIPESPATD